VAANTEQTVQQKAQVDWIKGKKSGAKFIHEEISYDSSEKKDRPEMSENARKCME